MLKLFDSYSLRARLFPAIIAAAPALAALLLLISWERIAPSSVAATLGLLVVIFALADLARRQGLRIEPSIYKGMSGKPSIVMMRYDDNTFDASTKERYRSFLSSKIGRSLPDAEEEERDQAAADRAYEACGIWLRDNTRDTKNFPILFNELVTYGFRRNLFALKWPALALNVVVVAICIGLLRHRGIFEMSDDLTNRTTVVLIVAAVHALYIAFGVTRSGVTEAARKYGRELIQSCETLLRLSTPSGD